MPVANGHSFVKMHAEPTLWAPFSEKTNSDISWAKESARYLKKNA